MVRRGLAVVIALSLVLGVATVANAQGGADISFTLDSAGPYPTGQAIHAEIFATLTEAPANDQNVWFRGMQMDYQMSSDVTLPLAMDWHLAAQPLYAAFPELPIPAAVYTSTVPVEAFMIRLDDIGVAVSLGTIDINASDAEGVLGILDWANGTSADPNEGFNLNFGFGVDPLDPITNWRFNTGELGGAQFAEIPTVPEPATLALLVIGAVAGLRRRRTA